MIQTLKKRLTAITVYAITVVPVLIVSLIVFGILSPTLPGSTKQHNDHGFLGPHNHHHYHTQLRHYQKQYRKLARKDHHKIKSADLLNTNWRGTDLLTTKQKLQLTGDLLPIYNTSSEFSPFSSRGINLAIANFQQRHGLLPSSWVDEPTFNALNQSLRFRLKQINKNMSRLKNLAVIGKPHYILVNIPDYQLQLVVNKKLVSLINVVVGDPKTPTPLLKSKLNYLTTHPIWSMPESIFYNDYLPKILEDRSQIKKMGFQVYRMINGKMTKVSSNKLNWQKIKQRKYSIWLKQAPGPDNMLGPVKFSFPNKEDIFIHGTPRYLKVLFANSGRSYSSGCIRLEKPLQLAKQILISDQVIENTEFLQLIRKDKTKKIRLNNPIPIHLTYITAWVDQFGRLQLREDIYNLDK